MLKLLLFNLFFTIPFAFFWFRLKDKQIEKEKEEQRLKLQQARLNNK